MDDNLTQLFLAVLQPASLTDRKLSRAGSVVVPYITSATLRRLSTVSSSSSGSGSSRPGSEGYVDYILHLSLIIGFYIILHCIPGLDCNIGDPTHTMCNPLCTSSLVCHKLTHVYTIMLLLRPRYTTYSY